MYFLAGLVALLLGMATMFDGPPSAPQFFIPSLEGSGVLGGGGAVTPPPNPGPSEVPGPLPLLGVWSAFSLSRKIRTRVRSAASNQLSS
jgi:hypothetical protein